VVASAAGLADEIGFQGVTMGLLADRLGVRAPSLYKHVGGLGGVRHRLAILALTELGEVVRDAAAGRSGRDALAAMLAAGARVANLIAAVLRGYGLGEDEMSHAIRVIRSTVHGFAALEASRGFQWDAEPDQSFEWMIGFLDRGLRSAA
jgi:AcrR family transcriptional regulator